MTLSRAVRSLRISILENNELNGAYGAFDQSTGTIYLSKDFLLANSADPAKISAVLLEEFGHLLDAKFNPADAPGDEGAIFSQLVTGTPVTDAAIAALQAENDHGTAIIDGKAVPLEFAAAYGTVTVDGALAEWLTLDGSLADWSAANRLDTAADGVAGYEVYGQYAGNAFVFALKAPTGVKIGANTTFWLNTDQNTSTGYQIWGFAGGAEYNVNIGADGKLALYSGAAGQTLVSSAIDYSLSADGTVLEFAVPSALLTGAPHALTTYIDVNDQVFLSNNYAGVSYKVAETVVTPPPVVGTLTLDGSLTDWTAADRLTVTGTTAAGYELYSRLTGGNLTFALKAPVAIGATTTVWLDTDRSALTGYKVFGTYGGYDYNITFAADGKPYLYTGADGQTLVSPTPLTYAFSADKTAVEFVLPLAQIGSAATSVNILADVNNTTFLPGDYAAGPYTVIDTATLPVVTDTSHKVGIVYSATTAAQYFSATAYSQLFMSVQNQAAAAGVPYDLLTEADLTDLAKLASYDTLIFPSFRNVPADKVTAIQDTLTTLVKNYHVGLITAGDFMTNDATGAALPGDSYARMKALLDISRVDGASGVNVDVVAGTSYQPHDGRLHRRRADPPVHRHRHLVLHQHRRPGHDARQPGGQRPDLQRGARHHDRRPQRPLRHRRHAGRQQHAGACPGLDHPAGQRAAAEPAHEPGQGDRRRPGRHGPGDGERRRSSGYGAGHLRQAAADPGPVEGGLQLRRLLLHRHRQQHRRKARRPTGPIPRSTTTRCWRWATRSARTPTPIPRTPISSPRRSSSSSSSSRAR